MAFSIDNLCILAYANGFTLWLYKSSGPIDEVLSPGYFECDGELFSSGDILHVSASDFCGVFGVRITDGKPDVQNVRTSIPEHSAPTPKPEKEKAWFVSMKDKWLTHRALGFSFSLSNAGTFPEAWARLYTEYHPGSVMVAEDNPFLQAELRHLFESADRLRSAVSSDLYRH